MSDDNVKRNLLAAADLLLESNLPGQVDSHAIEATRLVRTALNEIDIRRLLVSALEQIEVSDGDKVRLRRARELIDKALLGIYSFDDGIFSFEIERRLRE